MRMHSLSTSRFDDSSNPNLPNEIEYLYLLLLVDEVSRRKDTLTISIICSICMIIMILQYQ